MTDWEGSHTTLVPVTEMLHKDPPVECEVALVTLALDRDEILGIRPLKVVEVNHLSRR